MQTLRQLARIAIVVAVAVGLAGAHGAPRDPNVRNRFQKENPCPVNGKHRGPCPGYHIDHIKPLCAGGKDRLSNMQWLAIEQHGHKTKADRRACALKRKKISDR